MSASYIPNPANTVTNNLIIDKRDVLGYLDASGRIFSEIEDNGVYAPSKADKIFLMPKTVITALKILMKSEERFPVLRKFLLKKSEEQ